MEPNRILMVCLVPLTVLLNVTVGHSQTVAPVPPPASNDAGPIQPPIQRPRMIVLGVFDAGQPGVGIFKMYDPSDQVLCYALMPETAGRKVVGKSIVYDGNSIGSISCVHINVATKPQGSVNTENLPSDTKNQKGKK